MPAQLGRAAWRARLATALAALGLVFMGAIVVPVYLVPALAAALAAGLATGARAKPAAAAGCYWSARPQAH